MTDKELGYLAGIIDGEGCIQIHRGKNKSGNYTHMLQLQVRMCCNKVLERLKELTGAGYINFTPSKGTKWRDSYRWDITGKAAYNILNLVWPLLIEKQEQALLAIEFHVRCAGRQGVIVPEEMNLLRERYRTLLQHLKEEA